MPKKPSEQKMKETTIFREIDEMLAGVHGELTADEIVDRAAALVAQSDPKMTAAAWLVRHARWHRERTGMRFVGGLGPITQAEATARKMRPAMVIEAYKSRNMEARLVVQADGQVVLHTQIDNFPSVLRPPESRDEVVDMADVGRLDEQHPGKRLVELVKAALAELGCNKAA
jgi:hypothetical protein